MYFPIAGELVVDLGERDDSVGFSTALLVRSKSLDSKLMTFSDEGHNRNNRLRSPTCWCISEERCISTCSKQQRRKPQDLRYAMVNFLLASNSRNGHE